MAQIIGSIRKQTLAHSSFGTKKSALVTLRKIGKSTVLNGACDEFASEVLNTLHHEEPSLDKAMSEIVDEMSEDEKAKMRSDREWVEKVRELIGLGKDHDMYKTLDAMSRKISVGRGQGKGSRAQVRGLGRDSSHEGTGKQSCSSCWGDEEDGFLD